MLTLPLFACTCQFLVSLPTTTVLRSTCAAAVLLSDRHLKGHLWRGPLYLGCSLPSLAQCQSHSSVMPSGNSTLRIQHCQWPEPLKVGRRQGTDICITVERYGRIKEEHVFANKEQKSEFRLINVQADNNICRGNIIHLTHTLRCSR